MAADTPPTVAAPDPADPRIIEQSLRSMERFTQSNPTKRYRWRADAYKQFHVDPQEAQQALSMYRDQDLTEAGYGGTLGAARYAVTTPGGAQETLDTAADLLPHLGMIATGELLGGQAGRAGGAALGAGLRRLPSALNNISSTTIGIPRESLLPALFPPLGRATGAGLGEHAAQQTGLAPQDPSAALWTGAAGLASEGAATGLRLLKRFHPSEAARLSNEGAFLDTQTAVNRMLPEIPSDPLYKAVAAMPQDAAHAVGLPKTQQALIDIFDHLSNLNNPSVHASMQKGRKYVVDLYNEMAAYGGGKLPPDALRRNINFLREHADDFSGEEKAFILGTAKTPGVLSLLKQDLADAARLGTPGAVELHAARQAYAKEQLVSELSDMLSAQHKAVLGSGDAVRFNPAAVINKIEKLEDWKMPEVEKRDFVRFLQELNTKGLLEAPASSRAKYEASKALSRGAILGGLSGLGMRTLGEHDTMSSIGAGLAVAGGTAAVLATPVFFRNLINVSMTSSGRAALREVVAGEQAWTPATIGLVNALATAQSMNPASEMMKAPGTAERLEQPSPGEPTTVGPALSSEITLVKPIPVILREAEKRHGLETGLLSAAAQAESSLNPNARSHKGALGLLQMTPNTAKALGLANPEELIGNPELAADLGARYLKQMISRFNGNIPLALAAYNAGPGNVIKYGNRIPPFEETRTYVSKVMMNWRKGMTKQVSEKE